MAGDSNKEGKARSHADVIADALLAGIAAGNADPNAADARAWDKSRRVKPLPLGKLPDPPPLDARGGIKKKR